MIHTNEKIIKHKVGLLNLAEELGNVSKACQVMGLSRDTFYRYKAAVEEGGVDALFEANRRKPNHKNRVEPEQACLRPRDRFWDIPVPKIDSAFDNPLVPQPSWSPSTTQQLRKLVAAPYLAPNDWTPRSEAYFVFPLAQGTPGKQCGLAATGVYQPSLRSPWLAVIEQAVKEYALDFPAHGQVRASNELRKSGIFVSPTGVRGIWLRHELANFKDRLKALEAKVAAEGIVLTEPQVQALEKKKLDDEACGEIETAHPGYLGSQDTFYVGTLKGVGRIYQQTFVDTYSKVAFAKLYTTKTPITAADMLNDRVLPFFEQHELPMLRILTDRGTEYCGKADRHDYQLYLALNDIDHTKTRVKSPQTNGICERFHKTILQEFYQVTFRKKIYTDMASLQKDLDEWLAYYNNERTHQGKMCCGRTPMETLVDGKKIWQEKLLN